MFFLFPANLYLTNQTELQDHKTTHEDLFNPPEADFIKSHSELNVVLIVTYSSLTVLNTNASTIAEK